MPENIDIDNILIGMVTVGERGQIVIPAEARKKMNIYTGKRLIAVCNPNHNGIAFLKMNEMKNFVNQISSRLDGLENSLKGYSEKFDDSDNLSEVDNAK